MIPIQTLLHEGWRALQLGVRLDRYLIIFIGGVCQPKAVLVARTLALQSQLAACIEQVPEHIFRRRLHRDEAAPLKVRAAGEFGWSSSWPPVPGPRGTHTRRGRRSPGPTAGPAPGAS